jgi:hypothetical protein
MILDSQHRQDSFFLSQSVQSGCGVHPPYHAMCIGRGRGGGLSPGKKVSSANLYNYFHVFMFSHITSQRAQEKLYLSLHILLSY